MRLLIISSGLFYPMLLLLSLPSNTESYYIKCRQVKKEIQPIISDLLRTNARLKTSSCLLTESEVSLLKFLGGIESDATPRIIKSLRNLEIRKSSGTRQWELCKPELYQGNLVGNALGLTQVVGPLRCSGEETKNCSEIIGKSNVLWKEIIALKTIFEDYCRNSLVYFVYQKALNRINPYEGLSLGSALDVDNSWRLAYPSKNTTLFPILQMLKDYSKNIK